MERAARDGAAGEQAELIRRANALAALRWTHRLGVMDARGGPGDAPEAANR